MPRLDISSRPADAMNRQTVGLIFVLLVGAGLTAKYLRRPDPHGSAQSGREIATQVLAEYLSSQHPGKRALVFSNPYAKDQTTDNQIRKMEEAGLRGLRAGFRGSTVIGEVVMPELRPEARTNPRAVPIDAETTTPLSYLVAPDAFDRAAQGNPDCEIVISLIGLPVDLAGCEIWNREGSPVFALLLPDLRMVGGTAEVSKALKSGKLAAFVLRKPGGLDDDAPAGADLQAEFDQRFLLVSRETVDRVLQDFPGLF
jgi:hypothetical protein